MATYLVRLYSPYTLKTFAMRVDAKTAEEAKNEVLYQTVKLPDGTVKKVPRVLTDPDGYEFEAEPHFIISVAPIKTLPPPPYELMDEDEVKEAEWLKPAIIPEPLAKGSAPVGGLKLEAEIPDAITTLFFTQEVRSKCIRFKEPYTVKILGRERRYSPGEVECNLTWSQARKLCEIKFRVLKSPPLTPLIDPKGRALREGEEVTYSDPEDLEWAKLETARGNLQQITTPIAEWLYPEYRGKVKYRIDIYTKFLEEAKRLRRAGKIKEAVLYLVEHSLGIPLDYLAQILGLGYWTTWRAVAELARPTEAQIKKLMATLDETATLERWTAGEKEEIVIQLKAPKEPKIGIGYWLGRIVLYPLRVKPEEELMSELKRILTLEGYPTLTPEEETELRKQLHEYWQRKARERLTYFLR
ncbi:MAG: hypothetical protein QXH03_02835 [Candidatus Bathyarchaeia archaeon]